MEGGLICPYDVPFVSGLGKRLAFVLWLALLLAAPACSEETVTEGDGRDRGREGAPEAAREKADPVAEILGTGEPDGSVGQSVEVGGTSLRPLDVREEYVVFFAPGRGAGVGSRDSPSGECVAVDAVIRNDTGTSLRVRPEAVLGDDAGATYRPDDAVRAPNSGPEGMELRPDQKRAFTMFFAVPNGVTPERLGVRVAGEEARFDLLSEDREGTPPEDHLLVYHAYFNQRAYEEAYEMYDPGSTQGVTLGDWISFYEPLWGNRYLGLDGLARVYVTPDEAQLEMDRTFYGRDGEPVADPVLNAPVLQDMIKAEGEWRLVMGEDLISEIASEVPQFVTPTPETDEDDEQRTPERETTSETTAPTEPPESTAPETTSGPSTTASPAGDRSCADFETQAEAQSYLTPADPYALDPDGNGLACENLP